MLLAKLKSVLRRLTKYIFFLGSLAILTKTTHVLAAPFSTEVSTRMKLNTMIFSMDGLQESNDPIEAKLVPQFIVCQAIYQTLVRVAENGLISSDLSSHWTISSDQKTYRFTIKDTKFSTGERVTAHDVVFSLKRHLEPASPSIIKSYLLQVTSSSLITAENDRVIQIKLNKPYTQFLHILAMPGFGVISQSSYKRGILVGSGPFSVIENSSQEKLLVKNKGFDSSFKTLEQIKIIKITEIDLANKLLSTGLLDAAWFYSIDSIPTLNSQNLAITPINCLAFKHAFINSERFPFNSTEFRRDFSSLYRFLANKYPKKTFLERLNTLLPQGIMPTSYYTRQKQELTPAQFKINWPSLQGEPISFLYTPSIFPEEFVLYLKRSMLKAGLSIQPNKVEISEFMKEISGNFNYHIVGGRYMGNFPDPDGFLDPILGTSGVYYGNFSRERLRTDIEKAKFITTPSERLRQYSSSITALEDQGYILPTFKYSPIIIHRSNMLFPKNSYRYETELWKFIWDLSVQKAQ